MLAGFVSLTYCAETWKRTCCPYEGKICRTGSWGGHCFLLRSSPIDQISSDSWFFLTSLETIYIYIYLSLSLSVPTVCTLWYSERHWLLWFASMPQSTLVRLLSWVLKDHLKLSARSELHGKANLRLAGTSCSWVLLLAGAVPQKTSGYGHN